MVYPDASSVPVNMLRCSNSVADKRLIVFVIDAARVEQVSGRIG
jgi:hypothetical protein